MRKRFSQAIGGSEGCANCGNPIDDHCKVHLIPCCPGRCPAAQPYSIPEDAIYPRDEEHRYRIYARRGDNLEIIAVAGSPEALGVALIQLDADERDRGRRLVDLGAIGVLDAVASYWIILPWHRRETTSASSSQFPRPEMQEIGIAPISRCGREDAHGPHDWRTNPAAGNILFRCPGREVSRP